jgi:hypothetical protein
MILEDNFRLYHSVYHRVYHGVYHSVYEILGYIRLVLVGFSMILEVFIRIWRIILGYRIQVGFIRSIRTILEDNFGLRK